MLLQETVTEDRTPHWTHHTHVSRVSAHVTDAQDSPPTRVTLAQVHDECVCVCVFESASLKNHPADMFHLNLSALLDHLLAFTATLVTESGETCADPRSGSLFGRMADQSPITGFEPKDLIEISSEYTPIHFPSRKNSLTADTDDVRTVIASDITETIEAGQLTSPLITQERDVSANPFGASVFQQAAASGSQQQQASSSVINPWQTSNVGSCGKPQRGDESSSNVERSLLKGRRDRDFVSVSLSQHDRERILSERRNIHEHLEKRTCTNFSS